MRFVGARLHAMGFAVLPDRDRRMGGAERNPSLLQKALASFDSALPYQLLRNWSPPLPEGEGRRRLLPQAGDNF